MKINNPQKGWNKGKVLRKSFCNKKFVYTNNPTVDKGIDESQVHHNQNE